MELRHGLARRRPRRHRIYGGPHHHGAAAATAGGVGVLAGERIHVDDTTVPVLAMQKTAIGRLWAYIRDDRPFAGPDPPGALFLYSRKRRGEHPDRHLAAREGLNKGLAQG